MAYHSKITTNQIVVECERLLTELGICNYAEVGRRLNVSRQAIQKRLQAAGERGEITPEVVARYRPMGSLLTKRFNTSLTPENDQFIRALADQLDVPPAYILHAAVNRYREALLDWNAAPAAASPPSSDEN